jgi:hypothetical protein
MKLQTEPILPNDPQGLAAAVKNLFRRTATSVNALIEGRLSAVDSFAAAPTAGTWAKGDFVRNANPSELGAVSSKYVLHGWVCITAGTPGTWRECRFLTGN